MKAIIDIGSTSIRLMLAERLSEINNKQINTTKLAEGMAGGVLAEPAMERTIDAIYNFVTTARQSGAEAIYAYATEAVRSAKNQKEFLDRIYEKCNIGVDVLDNVREARLGFSGAYEEGVQAIADMGGASTELAVGDLRNLDYAVSVPIGIVRLTDMERRKEDIDFYADEMLKGFGKVPKFDKLLAIGGTAGTMVSILKGMKAYDQKLVHHTVITLEEIDNLYSRLRPMSVEDRINIAGLPKNRAEVIVNGVMLWGKLLRYLGINSMTVSERDNMEGYFIEKDN